MDQGAVGFGVAPSLALAHMFVKKKRSKKKAGPLRTSQAGSSVHEIMDFGGGAEEEDKINVVGKQALLCCP